MRHPTRRKSDRRSEDRERALATLALMRRKRLPLREAAKFQDIDPSTVLFYARPALRRGRSGDYWATPYDHIRRTLNFLTSEGPVPVTVNDSRTATEIAEHMNAVRKYLSTGYSSALKRFQRKSVMTSQGILPFITDPRVLDRLADAGQLEFEQLYRATLGMTG
jgi:hypothetical protein